MNLLVSMHVCVCVCVCVCARAHARVHMCLCIYECLKCIHAYRQTQKIITETNFCCIQLLLSTYSKCIGKAVIGSYVRTYIE